MNSPPSWPPSLLSVPTKAFLLVKVAMSVSMDGAVGGATIYARIDDWPTQAPYNDQKSRLVFIVRDLERSLVDTAFSMFCGVRDKTPEA